MDTDFGVIPMPKYDENQENYISMTHWWATSMISVRERPYENLPLEYMSYCRPPTVKPAYLNIAINGKFPADEESGE